MSTRLSTDDIATIIFRCMYNCTVSNKDVVRAISALEEELMVHVTLVFPEGVDEDSSVSVLPEQFFIVLDKETENGIVQQRYQVYDGVGIVNHYLNCMKKYQ